MAEEKTAATRIRIAYKLSAKGTLQPDITSEAADVDTAIINLEDGLMRVKALAAKEGVEIV